MGFRVENDHEISGAFQKIAGKTPDLNGLEEKNVFRRVARVTVYDMIRYTPRNIRQNRLKGCRVYFYNSEYFKRKGKRGIRLFAYKTGCNQKTYMTTIGFVDYTKNLQSSVWVSCSCDHFKYTYEYAMATKGASDHVYAWQQPPVEKNPHMLPGACKHILSTIDDALRRTRQFARLDKNRDLELEETDVDTIPALHDRMPTQKNLQTLQDLPPAEEPSEQPRTIPQVYRRRPQQEEDNSGLRRLPGTQDSEE